MPPQARRMAHGKGGRVKFNDATRVARLEYEYERMLEGEAEAGRLRSDCSFVTADGDLIAWEHL